MLPLIALSVALFLIGAVLMVLVGFPMLTEKCKESKLEDETIGDLVDFCVNRGDCVGCPFESWQNDEPMCGIGSPYCWETKFLKFPPPDDWKEREWPEN